jgi:hypothetical protein
LVNGFIEIHVIAVVVLKRRRWDIADHTDTVIHKATLHCWCKWPQSQTSVYELIHVTGCAAASADHLSTELQRSRQILSLVREKFLRSLNAFSERVSYVTRAVA